MQQNKRNFIKGLITTLALATSNVKILFAKAGSYPRLLLGPMLCTPAPTKIKIWAMVNGEEKFSVEFADNPEFIGKRTAIAQKSDSNMGNVVHVDVTSLLPNTKYWWRPRIGGKSDMYFSSAKTPTFHTAPIVGSNVDFEIGFGSCANIQRYPRQKIWDIVSLHDLRLFLWMGDNVYVDSMDPNVFEIEYQRQRHVAEFKEVGLNIPQLAIWDDHDFGLNDSHKNNPLKEHALSSFKKYWGNPSYGTKDTPGVFFKYQYGNVEFFFLDVRYYRDPMTEPDDENKSMLGEAQKRWLKSNLSLSTAAFKVLVSGSGWTKAKGQNGDAWSSYLTERAEIFDFICEQGISGVVLLSGDTHEAEFNAVPWSDKGGYDFYEFVSSPLAQKLGDASAWRKPDIRMANAYNAAHNFGVLSFKFKPEPSVEFKIVNDAGNKVMGEHTILLSQLQNGQRSWPDVKP